MKAGRSENAGVHRRLRRFVPALPGELRRAVTRSDKAGTEAFRASGGLNASRIQAIVITATILTFLQTFYVQ
jgi:hypothetical protein